MAGDVVTGAIDALASGRDLSAAESQRVLAEIMGGGVSEVQISAFLIGLRTKGETVEEVTGLARTMRDMATPVGVLGDLLDTAGTGGGAPTFNVSTTAALVAAGAGSRVAKHGNRSSTSKSGSADLLEALGARIDLAPEAIAQCIDEVGFGFMFAPAHHSATRHVVPVRNGLGVRTVFNFLGPLTNPAGANRQLIGVSDHTKLELIAGALVALECSRALIVAGHDGVDEVSVTSETTVVEVSGGEISRRTVAPEDFGLERAELADVAGGTPERNAEIARAVLDGEPGPWRALVVANASAALVADESAGDFATGARMAEESIDSGAAGQTLERFVAATHSLASEAVA
jgi:anthranilate phosphoribosyltransferase